MGSPDLAGRRRLELGTWPTPLQDCPRLSESLGGPRILVKRDDVNGLGLGGNKLRKLEFLLADAVGAGADTVITFGGLQTNHGRQTAAACAKLGLRCELVLTALVPRDDEAYERSGNVALDRLYGARVHRCADQAEAEATYQRIVADAEADGRVTATLPVGGSNGLGVLGYVAAAAELADQLLVDGSQAQRIVCAVGSAGTAAGLALGIARQRWPVTLTAACVSHSPEESHADIQRLAGEAAGVLGEPVPALDHVQVTDRTLGPGYGVPTEDTWHAIRLFARTEGITLDPVYTGKAAAALVAAVSAGEIPARETVIFLHTGGVPGLFGYAPELIEQAGVPGIAATPEPEAAGRAWRGR